MASYSSRKRGPADENPENRKGWIPEPNTSIISDGSTAANSPTAAAEAAKVANGVRDNLNVINSHFAKFNMNAMESQSASETDTDTENDGWDDLCASFAKSSLNPSLSDDNGGDPVTSSVIQVADDCFNINDNYVQISMGQSFSERVQAITTQYPDKNPIDILTLKAIDELIRKMYVEEYKKISNKFQNLRNGPITENEVTYQNDSYVGESAYTKLAKARICPKFNYKTQDGVTISLIDFCMNTPTISPSPARDLSTASKIQTHSYNHNQSPPDLPYLQGGKKHKYSKSKSATSIKKSLTSSPKPTKTPSKSSTKPSKTSTKPSSPPKNPSKSSSKTPKPAPKPTPTSPTIPVPTPTTKKTSSKTATDQRVVVDGKSRVVYRGSRGGLYIKRKGKYVSLKK